MTTTQYFRTFARSWWVIGLCVIVGAVLPIMVSATAENYVSSVNVLVTGTPATQPTAADASLATSLALQRVATYNDIANSPALAEEVLKDLDADISSAQLTKRTTAVVQANSTVLRISVEDTDADRAQLLASRAGETMVAIIDGLEKGQAQATTMLEAKVVGEASTPVASGPAAWRRNPFLGGAAGLLVGLALAVTISRLDPRLRDPDIVADQVGAPVLGLVPVSRRSGRVQNSDRTSYDDAVREVRTGIFFLRKDTDTCLTVAITSPSPVAGASRITSSVGESLAATGARVLVVEADLAGTDITENTLRHDEASGVDVVPAVSASGPGTDLLHARGFATLLNDASERYDYVLVNAPATSPGTDAAAVAARCDVTVLIVENDTREKHLREGLRLLRGVDANVRGVVLLT